MKQRANMPKEYRDSLSLNELISLHDRKNDYESEGGRNSDGTVTGTVTGTVNENILSIMAQISNVIVKELAQMLSGAERTVCGSLDELKSNRVVKCRKNSNEDF